MTSRIVFAGSPDFAVPCLAALSESGHHIAAVLTQPDRPSGRGRKLSTGPVKALAQSLGRPVWQPENLGGEDIQQQLAALEPELIVVVAYGLLLPPAVLAIPRVACINVHASLLPRWRGASPVHAAILAGDAETGVCLMKMEAGLDTGPVYARARTAIGETETAAELTERLAQIGATLLTRELPQILSGVLTPIPQSPGGVTYAGRLAKSDGVIDWSEPAIRIQQRIRACNPWPVAHTSLDGERLRCWTTGPVGKGAAQAEPGNIIGFGASGIEVAAGDGSVMLTELQLPGRRRCSAAEFANGYPLAGKRLGAR